MAVCAAKEMPKDGNSYEILRTNTGVENHASGLTARDSKRELPGQRFLLLAYVGVAALGAATAVVVVLALGAERPKMYETGILLTGFVE